MQGQITSTHDILILGGGPSGLSTALHLAKIAPHLASHTLILEKEHYPRPKLCAGGLVVDAERILERLGLDVGEIPHVDADEIHFDFEARGVKTRVAKKHALRVIRRNEFDAWLARKTIEAGIEILEGMKVNRVTPDASGVTVETEQANFRSQVVVGADGSNGITRRCVLPNESIYTARVLEVITPLAENKHKQEYAYFDFFPVPKNIAGYTWDFPTIINGEAMRCWGIYDTNILADQIRPALQAPLAEEMNRHGFHLNDYEMKGHPIRWYHPDNTVSTPRVMLVGDAAGADPIFGEGISIALGYGFVAAQEIAESFQRGEFSFRKYKHRLTRSGLGQTLFARWVIAYIVYPMKWKWFQILTWWVCKPIVLLIGAVFVLNWSKRLK